MSSPRRLTVAPHSIPPKALTHRIPIEQHIARGDTVLDICRTLRVSEDDVVEVWLRMDRLNGEVDAVLSDLVGQRTHGTFGGYRQHNQRGTKPCDACRAANQVYNQKRRDARRTVIA